MIPCYDLLQYLLSDQLKTHQTSYELATVLAVKHWIVINDEYLVGYPHHVLICAVVHWLVQGPVLVVAGGPEVIIEPCMCDPGILRGGHSQAKCLQSVCTYVQH